MKKLLILMLVLGMASAANAVVVSYEYRDAAATSVISAVDVTVSTDFTLVIIGDREGADGWSWGGKIYDHAAQGGVADMTSASMVGTNAGSMRGISGYSITYDGYDFTAGDLGTGGADDDWFIINLSVLGGQDSGTVTIDSLNPDYTVLESMSIDVIPEPMTIALLGLGSLVLLRRRK